MGKLAVFILFFLGLSCGNVRQIPKQAPTEVVQKPDMLEKTSEKVVITDSAKHNVIEEPTIEVEQKADTVVKAQSSPLEASQNSKNVEVTAQASENLNLDNHVKPEPVDQQKIKEEKAYPDHSSWNTLLGKYVTPAGDVDYKSFQNSIGQLSSYLEHLAENSPKKEWPRNEKLAYYINLYNAATVKLILDNYPTKSIKDLKNPWGKDWVKTGDGLLSLGDIEHKILRKMNEPRIHFAINCASFSCPKLLNQAFIAGKMETQLQQVTFDFVNDQTRNIISEEQLQLSNIFKWYKKDFTTTTSLIAYIQPYTKVQLSNATKIEYLKYNWSLNEAK